MSLRILIADDESLARSRLRRLLADCRDPGATAVAEASDAEQALACLLREPFDAVLLDIRMPGADGLVLARALRGLPEPPAVVFVTAHAEHAVEAFELEAVDYLTKPVRLERLQAALQKVLRARAPPPGGGARNAQSLLIQDRGRAERVPLSEVLYFKAELKYVTVRTATRQFILEASLSELEERHAAGFLRVHRNALVARHALRSLERHLDEAEEGETWGVRLDGIDEVLTVSRRQLSAVREAIASAARD
ncbi:MAG: LytTR family DNA-binding domain-containing protein [Burkholderiaceae bacterium]|nr:LytTR family DNA-binding domain-containing protein [Burkholderiaceae bacterium]MDO9090637.1 LytTR family DNA-binding domain-containing protein [Burkholderiaceae bacterium]